MNNMKKQTVAVAMATALGVSAMMSPVTVHAQEEDPATNITQERNQQESTQDDTPVSEQGLPASEQPQESGTNGLQSGTPAIKPKSNGEFTNGPEASQAIQTALDSYPVSNQTTQEELQAFLNREFVDTGKLLHISVSPLNKTEATSDSTGSIGIYINFDLTNGMRSISYLYESPISRLPKAGEVAIDKTNFPDDVFRQYVSDKFDTVPDGVLSQDEISKVTSIIIDNNSNLKSLKGIEYFTDLTGLLCHHTGITELDVSNNTALTTLDCNNTGIGSLNVSNNSALTRLVCYSTGIDSLNVSNNPDLQYLSCYNTGIGSLNVSNNSALQYLNCSDTGIGSLNVSNNKNLQSLRCSNTGIGSLDVSNNSALRYLDCNNTEIGSLNVSNNPYLQSLNCNNTPLAYLNLGNQSVLDYPNIDMPSPSVIDFTVTSGSFDMTQAFAGIDISKVTNITGATLNGNIIIGYTLGTPITYTYDCGTRYGGTPVTLDVTLNLHKTDSDIQITGNLDTTYIGKPIDNPSVKIKGSTGAVTFTYEKWTGTGWEEVNDMPTDAGRYRIQAQLASDDYYNEAVSEKKEFTILPKDIKNGNITVSGINSDNDIKKISVKDDDRELVKGTDYDVETKKVGNKTIVTITFKGNYTGTIERTNTIEPSQPEKPEQKPQQGKPQEKPKDTGSVKTGDSTKTGLLATLSMMSAGCIALLAGKKRKKNTKEDETTPL